MIRFVICLLLSISFAFAGAPSKVWGRIIKANHMNYQYFITYETKGEFFAYPIEVRNKKLAETLKNNIDQLVNVKGELKTITLNSDGTKKTVPVFIAEDINPLTLSQLSVNERVDMDPKIQSKSDRYYNGGGIQINDTAANTLIIGTAAVMVGSELLKLINKK
jgi:hypothetical protein